MRSKIVLFMALGCLLWAAVVESYPQNRGNGQGQGPCGPRPSGPPPSGPPPSGMPPGVGKGGPCGPPPSGLPPAATTASSRSK